MIKIAGLICTVFFFNQAIYAQKEANIWYFGQHAGLDFNNGIPVPLLDGQINTNEGVASIADNNGDLLFYTDGIWVYNKNHEIMQNGSGLTGDTSTSQSTVIVPKPLSATIYYIFTLSLEGTAPGLRYSEVDITLDGGLGAVTENKNVPLLTPCTEQLTAVMQANNTDVWVITHGYANNAFHAFSITSGGVSTIPVTSNTGLNFVATAQGTAGCMKVSPDGTRLGICNYNSGIQVFDFDNETGTVSAPVLLDNEEAWYGLEFSPSGEILYASKEVIGIIVQYNLTVADIPPSATVVLTSAAPASGGSLQLGTDGKIYRAASSFSYLSVIHNPDNVGADCNAELEGVILGGPISSLGLPNFIQSFFAQGIRASNMCHGDATEFELLSSVEPDSITWDFGDGSTSIETEPSHIYALPGNYTVTATFFIGGLQKVEDKIINIIPLPIAVMPNDIVNCDDETGDEEEQFDLSQNEDIILGGQNPEDYIVSYHVSLTDAELGINSLPTNYTNTSNPQIIYVRVAHKNSACYNITNFSISVSEHPFIDMPEEYFLCDGESIVIEAPEGFESYLWSTEEITSSITVDEPGIYTVTVTQDNDGILCEASKTITVSLLFPPVIESITVKDWTNNKNSISVVPSGYEYSVDGIHYQDNPEFLNLEPGRYTVYIRNTCGVIDQEVLILMYPKFFTPNGDGDNETWRIRYGFYEPDMLVYIFDRYGKLITSLKGNSPGWDGTFNGSRLPSTDYWFLVKRVNGEKHLGHFSLVR